MCEQVSDFVESAEKKSKSLLVGNGSRIKFEFDQTFALLSIDFPFVLKNVESCQNRLSTSSNFCSTFVGNSFDAGEMNVGQMSKSFKRAFKNFLQWRVCLQVHN